MHRQEHRAAVANQDPHPGQDENRSLLEKKNGKVFAYHLFRQQFLVSPYPNHWR